MNLVKRLRRIFRSAIDGRFVSKQYAKENPATTVEETVEGYRQ